MSIKKWKERARQKRVVEAQRQQILDAFKERKIQDEMGGLAAEKLFRPITKRTGKIPEDEGVFSDYDLDDETRNFKNVLPFGEGDKYEVEKKTRSSRFTSTRRHSTRRLTPDDFHQTTSTRRLSTRFWR